MPGLSWLRVVDFLCMWEASEKNYFETSFLHGTTVPIKIWFQESELGNQQTRKSAYGEFWSDQGQSRYKRSQSPSIQSREVSFPALPPPQKHNFFSWRKTSEWIDSWNCLIIPSEIVSHEMERWLGSQITESSTGLGKSRWKLQGTDRVTKTTEFNILITVI